VPHATAAKAATADLDPFDSDTLRPLREALTGQPKLYVSLILHLRRQGCMFTKTYFSNQRASALSPQISPSLLSVRIRLNSALPDKAIVTKEDENHPDDCGKEKDIPQHSTRL